MATAENKEVTSKRAKMAERLQSRYPDKDFSDEEAFYGQISDDYDDYDKQIADYQGREKSFSDLFTKDPRSAAFLMDWKDGKDPVRSLVRNFGMEIKDALEDPDNSATLAEDNAEYLKRVAENKQLKEEYDKNIVATNKLIDEYQEKGGHSDESIDNALDFIINVFKDLLVGKIGEKALDLAMKAVNYDSAVKAAEETGEVRGKNTKVEEKLRKGGSGDGVPSLNGKNATPPAARQRPSLGALDNFGEGNKTIWERGNERRSSR